MTSESDGFWGYTVPFRRHARWLHLIISNYQIALPVPWKPSKLRIASIFLSVGLAVAQAQTSTEASAFIKADLAKAQAALSQHNTSAVIEALNDAMKYLPNADVESLQALIAFQNRFRNTLTEATTDPTILSGPTAPKSVPSPPDQSPTRVLPTAPPAQTPSFLPEPVPAPPPPESPQASEPSTDVTPRSGTLSTPKPSSKPDVALPSQPVPPQQSTDSALARPRSPAKQQAIQLHRRLSGAQETSHLALGAKPWPYGSQTGHIVTMTVPSFRVVPEPLFQSAPETPSSQANESSVVRRPQGPMASSSSRKFLGYYAQDEEGKWVWLPAGSKNAPPAPPDVTPW